MPRSREHEERAAAGRQKDADVPKKHIYIYTQGTPSGCVRGELPGMTQVDEKGHEGNTAVVTALYYMLEATWNISFMRNK